MYAARPDGRCPPPPPPPPPSPAGPGSGPRGPPPCRVEPRTSPKGGRPGARITSAGFRRCGGAAGRHELLNVPHRIINTFTYSHFTINFCIFVCLEYFLTLCEFVSLCKLSILGIIYMNLNVLFLFFFIYFKIF